MLMSISKNYILGVFEDEDILIHAIEYLREKSVIIHEVYSPYPIHGIDDVLGYKMSRLPKAAFMFGATGTTLALTMMFSMNGFDWPMNVGGKPNAPLPDFIPITFECTVLLAAFGMVGTFLTASNLFPWTKPVVFDKRITDDKFVIAIDLSKNKQTREDLTSLLLISKASEVNEKEI
jgi:hypothetical protein